MVEADIFERFFYDLSMRPFSKVENGIAKCNNLLFHRKRCDFSRFYVKFVRVFFDIIFHSGRSNYKWIRTEINLFHLVTAFLLDRAFGSIGYSSTIIPLNPH